jgi:hypothetical protein
LDHFCKLPHDHGYNSDHEHAHALIFDYDHANVFFNFVFLDDYLCDAGDHGDYGYSFYHVRDFIH